VSLTELAAQADALKTAILREANLTREDSLHFAIAHINDARNIIQSCAARLEPQLQGRDDAETELKREIARLKAQVGELSPQEAATDPSILETPASAPPDAHDQSAEGVAQAGHSARPETLPPVADRTTDQAIAADEADLIGIPAPHLDGDEPDPERLKADQARADALASGEAGRYGDPPERGWG
jgi:hypothetical protein